MIRCLMGAVALLVAATAGAQDAPLLNTATAEQLAALDGVDRGFADAVVALRSERGRFGSVEELRVLSGAREESLAVLRRETRMDVQLPLGDGRPYSSVEQVLAEFDHEPAIQQVHRWTEAYAKVNPGLVDRWFAASRSFAMLPRVRVEGRSVDGFARDFKYYAVDGVINSPDDEVFDVLDQAGRRRDQMFIVSATWDLDNLVMSSERIRVINESQDVAKLRDQLLAEVTRVYFERRRVQTDLLLQPPSSLADQTREHLRLMELTANLDALTGGEFSRALAPTARR